MHNGVQLMSCGCVVSCVRYGYADMFVRTDHCPESTQRV